MNFGYRLNSLSAEVFFADGVFLVEGTSEVLFYHALAKALSIDLDRLNISIISVEGIGFKPYVAVCNALNIPWVLRTDNDIFSKPTKQPTHNYYAGISRTMGILNEIYVESNNSLCDYWSQHEAENEWTYQTDPPATASVLNSYIRTQAVTYGLYVSDVDLESDLANSSLQATLMKHYNKRSIITLIKAMQTKKAENMMHFLSQNQASLSCLGDDIIASPLKNLRDTVSERIHPAND